MANKLANALDERDWRITIVDGTDEHYYQPGFLCMSVGLLGASGVNC
jgi:sulfide:quinone oxidoreductase